MVNAERGDIDQLAEFQFDFLNAPRALIDYRSQVQRSALAAVAGALRKGY